MTSYDSHNQGYYQDYVDGKVIPQHRIIMEKHLGRKLHTDEIVHHINGNPKDNRLKNLKVMSRSDHARYHNTGTEMTTLTCPNCHKTFQRPTVRVIWKRKHGQKNFYCSRPCIGEGGGPPKSKPNQKYSDLVRQGLSEGLSGYQISKKYGINKKTVYNHINRMK